MSDLGLNSVVREIEGDRKNDGVHRVCFVRSISACGYILLLYFCGQQHENGLRTGWLSLSFLFHQEA